MLCHLMKCMKYNPGVSLKAGYHWSAAAFETMYGHLSSMCEGSLVWMLPFSPLFWPQLPITTLAACYENPWLIDGSSQLLISCTLANACPYINCKLSLCRWPTF